MANSTKSPPKRSAKHAIPMIKSRKSARNKDARNKERAKRLIREMRIMLDNLRTEQVDINFDLLDPSPDNPRFGAMHDRNQEFDNERIFADMREGCVGLAGSMRKIGQVEPIYLKRNGDRYLVVEGTRRWVAYEINRQADPDSDRWNSIPAYIFPDNCTDEQVDLLLGVIHGQGKLDWDSYEKARHLTVTLRDKWLFSIADISDFTGKDQQEIKLAISAYRNTKKYIEEYPDLNDRSLKKKYSHFFELAKVGGTSIVRDKKTRPLVFDAIQKGKVSNSKKTRDLPKILANPDASRALAEGEGPSAYDEAIRIVQKDSPAEVGVFKSMKFWTGKMKREATDVIRDLRSRRGNAAHRKIYIELLESILEIGYSANRDDLITQALENVQEE